MNLYCLNSINESQHNIISFLCVPKENIGFSIVKTLFNAYATQFGHLAHFLKKLKVITPCQFVATL
jgi:hypothetical protein